MKSSNGNAARKVNTHREDGEEALRKISKVVAIDGGREDQEGVENVAPDQDKSDEESNEALSEFLDEIKEKNLDVVSGSEPSDS